MTKNEYKTPAARDVFIPVVLVQLIFALIMGAMLIFDPAGFFNNPQEQALAALLVPIPIIVALVLALRFHGRHRVKRKRSSATAQLMETVLSTSREWVWVVDDQGLFTFSSPTSSHMLGWEPSDLVGRPIDLVIDKADLVRAKSEVAESAGPGWNGVVVRCRRRDGRPAWMEVSGIARRGADGHRGSFEGTSRLLPPLTAREAIDALSREKLEQMIARDMLLTAFQPIRSLATGKLLGAEALTRFVDEDCAGTEFWFDEAANVGLLGELELAALETSLAVAVSLPPDIYVALNISPATCLDPRLSGVLQRSGLPLKRLVLELTERLEVSEYDPLLSLLAPLRQAGLRIAVDDAGSGFASMRHVLHIRPDIIKLDRSLIAGINDDQGQHALGVAMVQFAHKIGATLVAEGIETPEELTAVARLGMTAGQGYLLGRPSIRPGDWLAWDESPY